MILSCSQISKTFADKTVLSQVTFCLEEHEKAAVVGINGAGKTTLLKLITGEMEPDEGQVVIARGKTMGYLAQQHDIQDSHTVCEALMEVKKDVLECEEKIRSLEQQMPFASGEKLDRVMEAYASATERFEAAGGYALRSEITGVLKGLGFSEEDFSKPVSSLSGGQKTRVSLGKLLLSRPDIILLDEPTNHLDMNSIAWLENFLLNYPGAVLVVAHDRYFLDKVVTKIIEIENSKVSVYQGNYTAYAQKKEMLRSAQLKAYLNQQSQIRHQEEVIEKLRSFNREKSIKRAQSREKALDKMDRLEKPFEVRDDMSVRFTPSCVSGNDVLTIRGLKKSFDGITLFSDVDIDIRRAEKVAIIGNNGTGKTTLLKIINRLLRPDAGSVRLGSNVEIGYYDQEHQSLHPEKTLFEEILDEHPSMTNTEIRSLLAAFLFTGDDVFKQVSDLSGGEQGRLSLAKLMLSEANFLILDEPTNHLDMESKEILEKAISQYEGTVLYVSHDRYFINKTASRILSLEGGHFINYLGNYDYYLEKRAQRADADSAASSDRSKITQTGRISGSHDEGKGESRSSASGSSVADITDNSSSSKAEWLAQKEQQARERKLHNDLIRCEAEISALEERNTQIETMMAQPDVSTDPDMLLQLSNEAGENTKRLEELYEQWETLAEREASGGAGSGSTDA